METSISVVIEDFLINDGEKDKNLTEIIQWVTKPSNGILGLTERLGSYLTSSEKASRSKATQLLAEVIEVLIPKSVSLTEANSLTDFFCDRAKDHHSVVPSVLKGFIALTSYSQLPDYQACQIILAIFEHVHVQTLIQAHRGWAFESVANLLNMKLQALQTLGTRFSLGFLRIIDGEKDPRNLITVFSLAFAVVRNFPIQVCLEDMFEVTSCYFPIDFTPPRNDPFSITRQQLADKLRAVMSATRAFAPYCLPLLIEKISSDFQIAKQDSLLTLCDCCEVYTFDDLVEFRNILCNLLVKEVMLSDVSETEKLALQSITSVVRCLCRPNADGVVSQFEIEAFCSQILKDCKHHLTEPEHKLIYPTTQILQALVSASAQATKMVLTQVVPLLQEQLIKQIEIAKIQGILNVIIQIILVSKGDLRSYEKTLLPSLLSFTTHDSSEICHVALKGVGLMASSLEDNQVAARLIYDIAVKSTENKIRMAACDTLGLICQHNPDTLRENISHLCKNLSSAEACVYCDMLVSICKHNPITTHQVLPSVLRCCETTVDGEPLDQNLLIYSISAIKSLLYNASGILSNVEYLPSWITLLQSPKLRIASEENLSQLVGSVTATLINLTTPHCLQTLINSLVQEFVNLEMYSVLFYSAFQCIFCCIPSEVSYNEDVCVQNALTISLRTEDKMLKLTSNKILASILNKSSQPDKLLQVIENQLNQSPLNSRTVSVFAWTTKALLLRMHPMATASLDKLIDFLANPELSSHAAEAFGILLQEFPDVLTFKQFANVKLMYKQRLYMHVFPKLNYLLAQDNTAMSRNIQVAITYLFEFVPRQVLFSHESMLFSNVMKLLSSDDGEVLMRTLHVLSEDSSPLLAERTETIIPLLLKLISFQGSMQVRIAAVKCLIAISKLPKSLTYSCCTQVIKGLYPALDDCKRLVRREAVVARNLWCLLADSQ